MEKKERIYCGNGKAHTFEDGKTILKVSFSPDDMIKLSDVARAKSGWCNIIIAKRREVSPKGVTHYCYLDPFEPKKQEAQSTAQHYAANKIPPTPEQLNGAVPESDVPF